MTQGDIQDLIGKLVRENPEYRSALMNDPKSIIEQQFNINFPDGVTVKALVEASDIAYVVIPYVADEGELNDADLEKVAGGYHDLPSHNPLRTGNKMIDRRTGD